MLIAFIIIAFLLLLISLFFVSPKLSPVPYFPSNKKDMSLIIQSLHLTNNQTIIDLGAGDGIVIFEAAQTALNKRLNTQFVAIDINPVLVMIMQLRRFFHPNKNRIKIVKGNFFQLNYKQFTQDKRNQVTIYLYVSPWLIAQILNSVNKSLKSYKIVSYFYQVPKRKAHSTINKGIHPIYIYD